MSFNIPEADPKPLSLSQSAVASGGESARVMLALKAAPAAAVHDSAAAAAAAAAAATAATGPAAMAGGLAPSALEGEGVLVIEGPSGQGDLLLNLASEAGGLFGSAADVGALHELSLLQLYAVDDR